MNWFVKALAQECALLLTFAVFAFAGSVILVDNRDDLPTLSGMMFGIVCAGYLSFALIRAIWVYADALKLLPSGKASHE